ncbi:hypothetical protein FRC17_008076 [Serendipita sp. 399]|nr:hypothetical protein FRC17_008076 [Serendipita sp. 399]
MADEKLNSIKPPAPERKETIEAAAMHDYESLEKETKGLLEISVDNLQSLLELLPTSTDVDSQTLANLRQEQPKIVNLQALILDVADKIKVLQKDGTIDKQFMIKVIRLDEPTQAAKHQPIHPDLTFGDLCQDLDKPEENALPEIWLKKVDPKQNCVTKSGIWWEQQDPADSIRAVLEDRGMDREVVDFGIVWCNEDYVIVLIQDNGEETGRSFSAYFIEGIDPEFANWRAEFSDGKPQRISERFKNEFQDRQVCKILRLKDGSDASNKMFDRSFLKAKTNPLYLELTPVTMPTTRATV